jgi:hypothetical protein
MFVDNDAKVSAAGIRSVSCATSNDASVAARANFKSSIA